MKLIIKGNLLLIFILFTMFSSFIILPVQSAGESKISSGQPNAISIDTVPPGASIYLNGKLLDVKSNGVISKLPEGIHIVKLTLPGYYDFEKYVDISSEGTTYLTYKFEKKENSIRIITNPKGADIYINGLFRGKTDQSLILNAGQTYSINLSLAGYYPYDTTFFLQAKGSLKDIEAIQHDFVALPEFSSIYVSSLPSNADIFIDGNLSGKSNTEIKNVVPGSHNVKLSKYGFDDYQTVVIVALEKRSEVNTTLRPQDGILNIDSTPVKASVYLDGSYVGETPYLVKIPQGKHKVEIKSTAFDDAIREVDLKFEGQTALIELIPSAKSLIILSEKKIEENSRYNPDMARALLDQSRQQLGKNEYVAAYESAKRSGNLAGDVDEDGIPNWLDMQPNVPNNFLYVLPVVVLLLLGGFFIIDWRRCRVTPKIGIVVEGTSKRNDTHVIINLKLNNPYKSVFCSVYIDNIFYEMFDSAGIHRINLGKLPAEIHTISVELFVTQKRYGKSTVIETVDFVIT